VAPGAASAAVHAVRAKLSDDAQHRPLTNMLETLPVASMLRAAALHTAPSVFASEDSLQAFARLDEHALRLMAEASAVELAKELCARTQQLRRAYDAMNARAARLNAETAASKFSGFSKTNLVGGSVGEFYSGLVGRLGQGPSLKFFEAMKMEHCQRRDSHEQFVTSNYKLSTTPALEWGYAVDGLKPPDVQLSHGRNIRSIDQLMQLQIVKEAQLIPEEVMCVSLYTGPMYMKYNACLREGRSEGRNMYPTTIFVLVSAVQKLARVTEISEDLMLYCGLGNASDLPASFRCADKFGSMGWTEFGFRSTTSDKAVALDYSGIKKGNPHPIVIAIKPNAIDRGACIAELSQYQGEKEYLYVPCSFLQPAGPQWLEVVEDGVANCIPMHLSSNMTTETTDKLVAKKHLMHLDAARLLADEVRAELEELAVSSVAKERMKKDVSCFGKPELLQQVAAGINAHCESIIKRHSDMDASLYREDNFFRDLVSEVLDMKAWALQKWNLWLQDQSVFLSHVKDYYTPMQCHRKLLACLRRRVRQSAPDSSERQRACLELLQCKGLVKSAASGELNAEGEDLIVAAAADGWSAEDIKTLIQAGADAAAVDKNGLTAFVVAARNGHLLTMQALLVGGCDLGNALIQAAQNGHADCVEALLSSGADAGTSDV
jgi:hypothetical protein